MKHFLISLALITTVITTSAQAYIQTYNEVTDDYTNDVQDIPAVRPINGGTVIIPEFDGTCLEEIKAPFAYACKIVSEYMPPCMPLRVRVSCSNFPDRQSNLVSTVSALCEEYFGDGDYKNVQMSVIKGVILGELMHNSSVTYLNYVSSTSFLTERPDIEINYNIGMFDEMSFSLDTNPGDKYDFVSIVMRDLLKGLGLSCDFRYVPGISGLLNPEHELTPFETYVSSALRSNDPATRLEAATRGTLTLPTAGSPALYAPNPFQNGVSLNYFVPNGSWDLTNILSHDFCKGKVTRKLADGRSGTLFEYLLGWRINYQVSSSTPQSTSAGSTSLFMPFNGSISFDNTNYGVTTFVDPSKKQNRVSVLSGGVEDEEMRIDEYLDQFHPFLYYEEGYTQKPGSGTSICVLKKDGTWDIVYCCSSNYFYFPKVMSDWTFHYDESEYARTVEGYLRARITETEMVYGGHQAYRIKYFVVDYLPQTVKLACAVQNSYEVQAYSTNADETTVRIYFSNTEGLDRIVLEWLREGFRLPGKVEVEDFKKGYFDMTIDRTTTFTAVGYNTNGSSRSVPVTVSPSVAVSALSFTMNDDTINIMSNHVATGDYQYTILPMYAGASVTMSGKSDGSVDISNLSKGMYILSVTDYVSGVADTFKFVKR